VKTAKISLDDRVLVRQCQSGDSAAMERLILKYQDRIYNVILRISGNPDDAAELTQESFVKIIENIDNFQGRSSFYTWAFRIAVNLTLSYCKRQGKLGYRSLDVGSEDLNGGERGRLREFLADKSVCDPAVITANKELCELVIRGLMKLDDNHRAVIILRDIEGMSYDDIAAVLNVELGTVKSRLSRGRDNLREIVEANLQ